MFRFFRNGVPWWQTLCVLFCLATIGVAQGVQAEQADSGLAAPEPSSRAVRVMSFNLRYGTANDGDNRWENRRNLLTRTVREFAPDLLGTQETLELQKVCLDEHLPEFDSWGVGRDDGAQQGEMTAVWYRRARFERLDGGHFWLSEQPNQPGSVSWDSALTRMASWVKLRDRSLPDRAPLLFLNTHFDHRGEDARRKSAVLIREKLTQLGDGCDWIVTGDFNAAEDSSPYAELFAQTPPLLRDTFRVAFPGRSTASGTFNGFDSRATSGPRIDWIGVSPVWNVNSAEIVHTNENGRTPSDHFPVTAEIER